MPKPALHLRLAQALELVGDQGQPQDHHGLPQRNAPAPLRVFLPFIRQRKRRQQRRLAASALHPEHGAGTLSLGADQRWHDAGINVSKGEPILISASGRLFLNKALEVSVGAKTCLWYRIGSGHINRCISERHSFIADADGPLYLQAALPGAFDSPAGTLATEPAPPHITGSLQVSVSRQPQELPTATAPQGWQYLWRLGEAAIFDQCDGTICCHTHGDVGILQYDIDRPLTDSSRLSWDWLVDALPSTLPEHIQPTHDYLSIAVEFDNGLDLTYMWSSQLAPDTIFQCPLPYWDQRETHWVLRNPALHALHQWHSESRPLLEDYRRAIGGPLPARIVRVWLIANSVFQNNPGRCQYRAITLEDADGSTGLLEDGE
ncbi:DUF3047 domain-containing protein [Isoalcanivorax beigongshangi]|uniref:DUF3047 domain-containing protein n=1 Tax=Isoalcanivorax beigongshangi TaxID=3238810 RepID=A0ABV4AIN4_9GAMM